MSIKYLVKEDLIPDDGSKGIIDNFYKFYMYRSIKF